MLKRLLIVFVSFVSNIAYANELDRAQLRKIVEGLNPITIKHDGQNGVWFITTDAEKILEILEKRLPLSLDIIDAQNKQIESLKSAMESYKASLIMYQDYSKYNVQIFETAMKYFPNLQPPELLWYEKPATTFIYGVVSGIILVVTSAYVLNKAVEK